MSVAAEQWAQAEAERQRQAEMVQTLINEVRRLGTEQNNNLQEIQRLRAEQFLPTPPVEPPDREGPPPPAPPAGRGIIDTRIGKPPVFSGDESTWGDWSFKLRSYVSVVDLQLGQMMEEAELAAHANAWLPSVPLNQDMDAQLRYLLVMLTSGPALQIIRNSQAEYRHSATLLEGTIRVHKHVPWHSFKSSCILILGKTQLVSQID